jgi:hypothetical protein
MPTELPASAWFLLAVFVSLVLSIPLVWVVHRIAMSDYEAQRESRRAWREYQDRRLP